MDPVHNPYSPGAGRRPAALVGRDAEIRSFDVLVHRATLARTGQPMTLTGMRGVGKTVLLGELASRAWTAGWIVSQVEAHADNSAREPFTVTLARGLHTSLRALQPRTAGQRFRQAMATFKSFSLKVDPSGGVSVGLDVEPARGRADTGYAETDLTELALDLAEAAADERAGVAVFVDEMQNVGSDVLSALCAAMHAAGQRNLPFYVVGAGLPSLPRLLADAKSYSERLFDFRTIGHLDEREAAEALTAPARLAGADWEMDAVRMVVAASGGYPYFLQEYGSAAWDAAPGPVIGVTDAQVAVVAGRNKLDGGFFRSRWDRATRGEREYLAAMAVDAGVPSSSGEIGRRLGRVGGALGPTRAGLIAKGLVYAPEHGLIAYTVPGMAEFIARQVG